VLLVYEWVLYSTISNAEKKRDILVNSTVDRLVWCCFDGDG